MFDSLNADRVHFRDYIAAKIALVCGQCLKKFGEVFDISFEETYLPKNKNKVSMP